MSTTCFQTRIRNTSGKSLTVNFLQRGKRLANEAELLVDGDIFNKKLSQRELTSLKTMLGSGDLTIMSSPSQIHYDETLAMPKVIDVNNGSIDINDPCTGAYSSSMS